MFAKPADIEEFNAQVAAVCQAYREAITRHDQHGWHTVSIDEQTGIQALERIAPDLLPRPGDIARREYEYTRHGTLCLFGNLDVATGKILTPLLQPTRNEAHLRRSLKEQVRAFRGASC